MVLMEAMKVKRFKARLITLLYNALVAVEFPTLSKLVDTAKQLEVRHREDREEREQKRQLTGKTQDNREKSVVESQTVEQVVYQMLPHPRKDKKKKKKHYSRGTPVQSTPMMQMTYGGGQMGQGKQTCSNCGKQHSGPWLWGQCLLQVWTIRSYGKRLQKPIDAAIASNTSVASLSASQCTDGQRVS